MIEGFQKTLRCFVLTDLEGEAKKSRNGIYFGITEIACAAILHVCSRSAFPGVLLGSFGFIVVVVEGKKLHDRISAVLKTV